MVFTLRPEDGYEFAKVGRTVPQKEERLSSKAQRIRVHLVSERSPQMAGVWNERKSRMKRGWER